MSTNATAESARGLSERLPFAFAVALASVAMGLLWLLAVRIRDASHVDVAWAMLIACCALVYAVLGDGDTARTQPPRQSGDKAVGRIARQCGNEVADMRVQPAAFA